MKYYIGLDAHKSTSTAVVVRENGDIVLRETFPTTEANLVGFLSKIDGEKHLTFEECTLAQWLYLILKPEVEHLLICNPVYIAKKQGAKTDFRDALHLAQELRTNHLKPVYHDNSKWMELRALVNSYADLVDNIVSTKNRLKALFRSYGLSTDEGDFYEDREQIKQLPNEVTKFVAASLFLQMESLEKEKTEYAGFFQKNIQRHRPIKNLCSIPGISHVRANIIVAIVCAPQRFKSKHQFWGYCMLVRHIQMSGGFYMPTLGTISGMAWNLEGYGEQLKAGLRRRYGSEIWMEAFGEMIPSKDCYCEIDPDGAKDRYGIPILRFHWKWSDHELKQAGHMHETIKAFYEAMGGELYLPDRPEPNEQRISIGGQVIHEVGTIRMGDRAADSPLNRWCQAHEVKNLFVADGAPFPSNPEKNPTLSIVALAWRTSEYLAEEMRKGNI